MPGSYKKSGDGGLTKFTRHKAFVGRFLKKFIQFCQRFIMASKIALKTFQENLLEKKQTSLELQPYSNQPPSPNSLNSPPISIPKSLRPQILDTQSQVSIAKFFGDGGQQVSDFWAFLDSFLQAQNSAHTRRAYERDLVDFLNHLQSEKAPMNVHSLVAYREMLENTVSNRTEKPLSRVSINRKLATIKSFLNWLVLNGVLPNNPARAVKSFRAGRESPTRDIPDDRVRAMLELPARHRVGGRMHHAILTVLFHLGLRRFELVQLRTSDLFEQDGMRVLRVRGKGDKERVLPIPQEVARSIDTYLEMSRKDPKVDQPLFSPLKNNITKEKNKPLHPNAIAYIIKHYAKLAGVNYRVSPHSARATAVSNALDNLAPHRAVQHMAGWSSPLMVSRYDKRKQDLKNSAVRFINYDTNSNL